MAVGILQRVFFTETFSLSFSRYYECDITSKIVFTSMITRPIVYVTEKETVEDQQSEEEQSDENETSEAG